MTLRFAQASMPGKKSAHISAIGRISPMNPHSHGMMRDARGEVHALLEVDGLTSTEDPWSASDAFALYKRTYGRTYPIGSAEHDMRERLFNQRIGEMKAHNAARETWR